MADEILYAVADSIATITLNRPERRNALNTALMDALAHRFDALESDTSVRAVVIRGAGQAFCSGRDLNEMSRRQDDGLEPEADVIALFQQIEASRHPTIAMVHGAAYAGGCELALHCDFRVAADVARFAMPLARIGLVVPFALGQKLVEIIGPAFTRQRIWTRSPGARAPARTRAKASGRCSSIASPPFADSNRRGRSPLIGQSLPRAVADSRRGRWSQRPPKRRASGDERAACTWLCVSSAAGLSAPEYMRLRIHAAI